MTVFTNHQVQAPTRMSLALQAHDEEDLAVLSTHLQDAVGLMGDMAYLPTKRRFAMLVNRFLWDAKRELGRFGGLQPHRVRAGLHFDGVEAVQISNLPQGEKDAAFELLAVQFTPSDEADDPSGMVQLDFSGGGTLRLQVECLEAWLTDIGQPYPVKSRPKHPHE